MNEVVYQTRTLQVEKAGWREQSMLIDTDLEGDPFKGHLAVRWCIRKGHYTLKQARWRIQYSPVGTGLDGDPFKDHLVWLKELGVVPDWATKRSAGGYELAKIAIKRAIKGKSKQAGVSQFSFERAWFFLSGFENASMTFLGRNLLPSSCCQDGNQMLITFLIRHPIHPNFLARILVS